VLLIWTLTPLQHGADQRSGKRDLRDDVWPPAPTLDSFRAVIRNLPVAGQFLGPDEQQLYRHSGMLSDAGDRFDSVAMGGRPLGLCRATRR
jgi:hypothetical protein